MKRPINTMVLVITVLFATQLFMTPISIHAMSIKDGYNAVISYDVTDTNSSAIYQWYIPPDFSTYINYTIDLGDTVQVDVKDLAEANSDIDLMVGNLTRNGIKDYNAEGALGLGYWAAQYVLGFVADTNWQETNITLSDLAFTSYNFSVSDTYEYNNMIKTAVTIEFSDSFQTTRLTYDLNEGFLVKAHTVVGNFVLGFELSNISIDPLVRIKDGYNAGIEYNVTDTNSSAIYQWYIAPEFTTHINYTVNLGDRVLVDVRDLKEIDTGIDLMIGNLTRENITDYNAEGALTLGYSTGEYVLGFVADTNWLETNATFSALDFTSYNFSMDETYHYNNTDHNAVTIEFADIFQTTKLTYDMDDGFLVKAHTVVGNFILGFEMTEVRIDTSFIHDNTDPDDPVDTNDTTTNPVPFSTVVLFAALPIQVLILRKKQ